MTRVLGMALRSLAWVATLAATLWTATLLLGSARPPERPQAAMAGSFALRVEREGQHLLRVGGSHYAIGAHNARLFAAELHRQEETLLDQLFTFAKTPARALLIKQMSMAYLTGLDDYLLPREQLEILGLAEGAPDPYPYLGARYARIAGYHAIHELSHRFAFDNPLFACSLVMVGAPRVAEGALLGRNFDFEGGEVFDKDKVVLAVSPRGGYGFVSVAWAGMAGAVSGMNEHGLAVTLNAGASAEYRRVGTPTTLLVRRALEEARTVDEAIAVLTSSPRFVADIIGVADATGAMAVVELAPESFAVRRGATGLLATNHMEAPEFAADPVDQERRHQTTTLPRHARLEAWARALPEAVTERTVLSVLRSKTAPDGRLLPIGHRHAIDALIATHGVIFDTGRGVAWVSKGPHLLGEFLGYDVRQLLRARTEAEVRAAFVGELPADPLLESYGLIQNARAAWGDAERALKAGDLVSAGKALHVAARALGDHPTTLILRGRLAAARGEGEWARGFYEQALAAPPEYEQDVEHVRAALRDLPSP